MGLDGALLEDADTPPTLRLYTWTPPALSLGYFQRFDEVPAASEAFVVVRRITGGGAIHHAGELTWSITAGAKSPLYRGPIAPSSERVHAVIIEALADGRLSFVAEYNPLFGETLVDVVEAALAGDTVESYIIVPSLTFDSPEAAAEALPDRQF